MSTVFRFTKASKQMTAMLKNLSGFLEKGAAHATSKKTEMECLSSATFDRGSISFDQAKFKQLAIQAKLCASKTF